MSAKKQVEKEIREAIIFLREKNHTIPSNTIEFMKQASLEKLKNINKDEPEQAKSNSQSILSCFYYDCSALNHNSNNPVVKSDRCNGVCKDYSSIIPNLNTK